MTGSLGIARIAEGGQTFQLPIELGPDQVIKVATSFPEVFPHGVHRRADELFQRRQVAFGGRVGDFIPTKTSPLHQLAQGKAFPKNVAVKPEAIPPLDERVALAIGEDTGRQNDGFVNVARSYATT